MSTSWYLVNTKGSPPVAAGGTAVSVPLAPAGAVPEAGVSKDTKSDGKDQKSDPKTAVVPLPVETGGLTTLSLMRNLAGARKGKSKVGLKPVKVWLVTSASITGAANANTFPVITLSPLTATDWSGFAALYDLARVTRVEFIYLITAVGTPQGGQFAVAWDPANPAAYASVNDVLTAGSHDGPRAFSFAPAPYTSAGPSIDTQVVSNTGFHKISVKLPTQTLVANDNLAEKVIGGGWVATTASNFNIGYMKFAITAFGAGSTSGGSYYCRFLTEFKSRS